MTNIPEKQKLEILSSVLRSEGLGLFKWTDQSKQWRARAQSIRHWRPEEDWPNLSDKGLLELTKAWFAPWVSNINRTEDFARLDWQYILQGMLPWAKQKQLEELAPTHLVVPSGSKIQLEYQGDGSPPVLAVKLQEVFGLADTPRINQGRTTVLMHLLSPAGRPIQVTQDLRSFWNNTYPDVRKELRGRYNKHPWPEDPWNAVPTKKTNRQL